MSKKTKREQEKIKRRNERKAKKAARYAASKWIDGKSKKHGNKKKDPNRYGKIWEKAVRKGAQ